jgi:hypothetical protein
VKERLTEESLPVFFNNDIEQVHKEHKGNIHKEHREEQLTA